MKKRILKLIAFAALIAVMLAGMTACEEEVTQPSNNENDVASRQETVADDGVLVVDGKRMEWTLPARRNGLSKGVIMDEKAWYEDIDLLEELKQAYNDTNYAFLKTISYTHRDRFNHTKTYTFKLLRIDRWTEPGKYFYVMLDNLRVKLDSACWAYGDDESYVSTYGRLYTWSAANALAKQITMQLPVYYADNPTNRKYSTPRTVKARILSKQDLQDIVGRDNPADYTVFDEVDSPGHPFIGEPMFYYDAFIGGLEGPQENESGDYTRGLHTLAGMRNTEISDERYWNEWINGWYNLRDREGRFWLIDEPPFQSDKICHFPVIINCQHSLYTPVVYDYKVFINAPSWDKYGYSVRYVFEPQYK